MDRRLVWGIIGLLSYLGAAFALAMAVSPFIGANGFPDFLPTGETVGLVLVSVMLFALGALCLRRASARSSPLATGAMNQAGDLRESEDGMPLVECEECGTVNEAVYRYCEECAERL